MLALQSEVLSDPSSLFGGFKSTFRDVRIRPDGKIAVLGCCNASNFITWTASRDTVLLQLEQHQLMSAPIIGMGIDASQGVA